jgi:hypothetical protein
MSAFPSLGQKIVAIGFSHGAKIIAPEAIGIVEKIRGYGSLEVLEVRILPGQPGAPLRIVGAGQWKHLTTEEIDVVEGGAT